MNINTYYLAIFDFTKLIYIYLIYLILYLKIENYPNVIPDVN